MRSCFSRIAACSLLALSLAALASAPASAAIGAPYDTPTLTCVASGESEITLKVTAGASGAPAGVSIQWMSADDYANGGWSNPAICALSLSGQPSYSGNTTTRWELGANGSFEIRIGSLNLFETGLSVHGTGCDGDLVCGTTYVFRVFAHATNEHKRSAFSGNTECTTADCPSTDCTLTIGGYKENGPGVCNEGNDGKNFWPASVMTAGGMSLGTTFYTLAQLCAILGNDTGPGNENGNCYRQLARQLIAAKFNVIWGATCGLATTNIAAAEAAIGTKHIRPSPACPAGPDKDVAVAIQNNLNLFNNGYPGCPSHCDDGGPQLNYRIGASPLAPSATKKSSWGSLKGIYR